MIVSRMHIEFKLAIDKADSLNAPDFLPEEIDIYLSDSQEEFIEQRAYGNNFRRLSVEETQKRVSDLQSLVSNTNITTFTQGTDNQTNGYFVTLPSDYRHALQESALITYSDCNSSSKDKRVPVYPLTHDRYNKVIQNPFTAPDDSFVYRLPFGRDTSGEQFELITAPGITLNSYQIRYIKNPKKIDLAQILSPLGLSGAEEGELKDECYREIIRMAVRNALADIESPRTQASIQKLNELE